MEGGVQPLRGLKEEFSLRKAFPLLQQDQTCFNVWV